LVILARKIFFGLSTMILALLLGCATQPSKTNVTLIETPAKRIVVSGSIDAVGAKRIRDLLKESAWTLPIEFNECSGGILENSVELADVIYERKVTTSAQGYVASGCAYAFLAGSARSQASKESLLLHFHAPSKAGYPLTEEEVSYLMNRLEEFSAGKFPGKWKQQISVRIGDAGVMFFSGFIGNFNLQSVRICDRKVVNLNELKDGCSSEEVVNFEEIGLVTPRSTQK
jgi:hypothetical protein